MADTNLRLLTMLRLIPREPRRVSTTELRDRLAAEGFETTPRTIQRDLNTLSGHFPLICDDRNHPYGWSWSAQAAAQTLPGMDTATALTFTLAHRYLAEMLPRGALGLMQPHFDQAEQVLRASGNGMLAWRDRIRVLPRYQPLQPPAIEPAVMEPLYDALFRQRRVAVHYKPRSGRARDYELSPQGLAFRDAVIYLVANHGEYDDVVMFALHRFKSAEVLEEPARVPPGFDFDDWIHRGGFDANRNHGTIRLEARLAPEVGEGLFETPLSPSQTLKPDGSGWLKLTAKVPDTHQLRWWLQGFGRHVEVLGPPALREAMAETARGMAALYRE